MSAAKLTREHHQKETSSSQWNKENSSISDSAHVQSTLKTQSHSCYSLSTTDEIDALLAKLNYAHIKLDDIVKRRLDLVSKETETIIERITMDTQDIQQRLLMFSKVRQTRQDELYREWLQMYVAILDEWRSSQLARLQEELCTYQKLIIIESQRRISSITVDANRMKTQILKEEQDRASQEINELITQIESLSSHETLQHLGSETMMKINLTIQANVGKKAPGQHCTFDFGQNGNTNGQQNGPAAHPGKKYPLKSSASGAAKIVSTKTKTVATAQHHQIAAITTRVSEVEEEEEDEEGEQ